MGHILHDLWVAVSEVVHGAAGIPPPVFSKLLWTLAIWLLFVGVRRIVFHVLQKRVQDMARQYIATKTASYALGILAIVAVLRVWLGGMTGMAAYLGILSAGLAIALQDPLSNLAGWVFLVIRKPFVVGDRIQIGEHAGDVIDIRPFQFTIVEIANWVRADQSTGRIIHIPNGWTFRNSIANYSQGFNFIWNEVAVTVTFESDWRKAKGILGEIAEKHNAIRSEQAEREIRKAAQRFLVFYQHLTPIVWTAVVDIGVCLTIRYLCEPRKRRSSETAIWEGILDAFTGETSIDFAYPTTRFYDNAREGKPDAGGAPIGGAGPARE